MPGEGLRQAEGRQLDREAPAQQGSRVDLLVEQVLLPALGRRKEKDHMGRDRLQNTQQPADRRPPQRVGLVIEL